MKAHELFNEMWDCDQRTHGREKIRYILIHPKEFMDLATDKDSPRYLARTETGWIFAGVPMIQTDAIERLDFCI